MGLQGGSLFAGRYQIESILGTGGMSTVYLVQDTFLGNNRFALKLIHENLSTDETYIQRFLREVGVTRLITHPNIVRTFDFGNVNRQLFFTMEYIQGQTLTEVLRGGTISPEQACFIVGSICDGLTAIHSAGITHRDLKPSNVMITLAGEIKITDFGVARPEVSHLTKQEEMLGSGPYMAPELWLGREPTPQVDIYSLGVILFEMLTGSLPFESHAFINVMHEHLEAVPPVPSVLNPAVPEWLSDLTIAMLSKSPQTRPSGAAAVGAIITTHKTREPLKTTISNRRDTVIRDNSDRQWKKVPTLVPESSAHSVSRNSRRNTLMAILFTSLCSLSGAAFLFLGSKSASPLTIPGIITWLSADTLHLKPETKVGFWEDHSPRQNFAIQPEPGSRPKYQELLPNKTPVLVFDGKANFLVMDSLADELRISTPHEATLIHVSRAYTPNNKFLAFIHAENVLRDVLRVGYYPSAKVAVSGTAGDTPFLSPTDDVDIFTLAIYVTVVTKEFVSLHRNGSELLRSSLQAPIDFSQARYFTLGQDWDPPKAPSDFFSGELAEFIVYNRAISVEERGSLEQYLSKKYEILLNE